MLRHGIVLLQVALPVGCTIRVIPWGGTATCIRGRSPCTTSSRSPAAQAVPIPYHHSNLQSEEMIYSVSGKFGSRKRVEVGSVTLHPSGIPHGPHPGLAERSIGMTETHELAVMCDTFYPLKLTKFAKNPDDGKYAYSWYEEQGGAPTTADEDPAASPPTSKRLRGRDLAYLPRSSASRAGPETGG
jgi:hypothetical protein